MPAVSIENNVLHYRGSNHLKQRLILATLSGKPVRITDIRSNDTEPGLRGYEVSLIRLLDLVSSGSKLDISETGTALSYRPGLLHGGYIQHTCNEERGIGYYLDVLIALGPFCKEPIKAVLKGLTNSRESPSVDYVRGAALPMLKRFLVVDDGLELKIKQRGLSTPADGKVAAGEVQFKCPVRKNMRAIQCVKPGMVKRVRGTVYVANMSPAVANRTLEAAKGVLLNFLPDIYIYSDQAKGKLAGKGFGITLTAETTEGVCFSAEMCTKYGEDLPVPEDLGREAAQKLLEEVYRGGCVDSSFQWITALFMSLGQKDVSKFMTGECVEKEILMLFC